MKITGLLLLMICGALFSSAALADIENDSIRIYTGTQEFRYFGRMVSMSNVEDTGDAVMRSTMILWYPWKHSPSRGPKAGAFSKQNATNHWTFAIVFPDGSDRYGEADCHGSLNYNWLPSYVTAQIVLYCDNATGNIFDDVPHG